MLVKEEFHVVIRCPVCGHLVEAWPEEVPGTDYSVEQASDGEATEDVDLDCETCGESFSVTIRAHWGGWDVFLTGDESHAGTFEHFDYRYDGWIDELEPEPHPKATFNMALQEWRQMLDGIGNARSGLAPVNRMLLVQLFSIVEAYLADAIINLAHADQKVVAEIIRWHPELKGENVSLTRAAADPNLARDILIDRLKRTQFHRFELVNGMLRAALGHHFLPGEKAARDAVLKSTKIRHACVHGNGRDRDGTDLTEVTTQYLSELSRHFSDIVERLSYRISTGGPALKTSGLEKAFEDPFDQYSDHGSGQAVEPKH